MTSTGMNCSRKSYNEEFSKAIIILLIVFIGWLFIDGRSALPDFVVKLNEAALHVGERGGSQPALMKRVHAELEQWRQLQLEQQREQSLLESVGEQVGDWGPEETDPSSESRGKIAQSPPRFSIKWPVLHLTSCPSDATKKTQSSCSVLSQKM